MNKKVVFFICDFLSDKGGIESRVNTYFCHLKKEDFVPVLICFKCENEQLRNFNVIEIKNIFHLFLCFIRFRPYCVDIQSINHKIISIVELIKSIAKFKLFFTFHGDYIPLEILRLSRYDIFIFVSERLKLIYTKKGIINSYVVLPNSIKVDLISIKNNQFLFDRDISKQKALLITRIEMDKLETIFSFLDFCNINGITCDIAGDFTKNLSLVEQIKEKYKNLNFNFIGSIETLNFLVKYRERYCFISGVGQVALEACSNQVPVFIPSHIGLDASQFLLPNNFKILCRDNFTIKNEIEFQDKKVVLQEILEGTFYDKYIDKLNLELFNNCNIDIVFKNYLNCLRES